MRIKDGRINNKWSEAGIDRTLINVSTVSSTESKASVDKFFSRLCSTSCARLMLLFSWLIFGSSLLHRTNTDRWSIAILPDARLIFLVFSSTYSSTVNSLGSPIMEFLLLAKHSGGRYSNIEMDIWSNSTKCWIRCGGSSRSQWSRVACSMFLSVHTKQDKS